MGEPLRMNHVAMSMDPAVLDEQGRQDVLAFYGDVFGWTEGDNTGETGNPLILLTGAFGEFVYLLPGDPETGEHMRTPALDHFGYAVKELSELEAIVDKAKAYADKDDRVRIIDIHDKIYPGDGRDFRLTNAYIGYLLPLMVELQHLAQVD